MKINRAVLISSVAPIIFIILTSVIFLYTEQDKIKTGKIFQENSDFNITEIFTKNTENLSILNILKLAHGNNISSGDLLRSFCQAAAVSKSVISPEASKTGAKSKGKEKKKVRFVPPKPFIVEAAPKNSAPAGKAPEIKIEALQTKSMKPREILGNQKENPSSKEVVENISIKEHAEPEVAIFKMPKSKFGTKKKSDTSLDKDAQQGDTRNILMNILAILYENLFGIKTPEVQVQAKKANVEENQEHDIGKKKLATEKNRDAIE